MISNDFEEITSVRQADATDYGLPLAGENIGPGVHAAISEEPSEFGWSLHVYDILPHPTNPNKHAYAVRDGLAEKLEGKVPPQALAKILAAKPLDPEWIPPGLENKLEPELFNVREDSK
jgi:hypothetical protein